MVTDDLHVLRTPLARSVRDALVMGGLLSVGHVRAASDEVLLRTRGIGPINLQLIRDVAPFNPGAPAAPKEVGLKAACREAETVLGVAADRIYNHQLSLIACRVFPKTNGRYPGGGPAFSIEAFAVVLCELFANSTPFEVAAMVKAARNHALSRREQ